MAPLLRNPELAWSKIGDEIFVLKLKGERKIHRLSPVAALIWNLLDGDHTEPQIAQEVALQFDCDFGVAEADVSEFLETLTLGGLLKTEVPLAGSSFGAEAQSPSQFLMREMESLALSRNVPLFATIELTLKCNLKCVHCYNFDRSKPEPKLAQGPDLTPQEVRRILEELSAAGTLMVSFSGGEALLYPQLTELISYARKLHMAVKVKSNATLLTEVRAREIFKAGATEMDISLYGATPSSHDAFTAMKGSFERTLRGIRAARTAGIFPSISYIIHNGNFREVAEMVALAADLGASYALSTELTARYDGTKDSRDYRMSRKELEELITGPSRHLFSDLYQPSESVQCACARLVCGVSSTGEVYPCIGAPIPSGNLRSKSFAEIWNHSPELNKIRGLKLDDFKTCKPCEHRHYCQRSSGAIYVDTGNYTGPEPFTCMQAELVHRHHPKAQELAKI